MLENKKNDLCFYPKKLGKQNQIKPKVIRNKEKKEIRGEIIKYKTSNKEIQQNQSWSFEKNLKIYELLTPVGKKVNTN